MARVTASIPNLVNGVSQQPDNLRNPSQCVLQENAYPSIVEGIYKRLPTIHKKRIQGSALGDAFIHTINRDEVERYVVVVTDGDLKVYDLDGNEKTVNFPDGKGYLSAAAPSTNFDILTVQDYSFIVNKTVTVEKDTTRSAERPESGLFWVKAGAYSRTYQAQINVDGASWTSSVTTENSSTVAHEPFVATNIIAASLLNHTGISHPASSGFATSGTSLNAISGVTVNISGDLLYVTTSAYTGLNLKAFDGQGGTALKAFTSEVQSFADLPEKGWGGYMVKIVGDAGGSEDDYWVRYDATSGEGVWKEAVAPDVEIRIDAATMPHILVRESDGSFTFKEAPWVDRDAGDDDSNPFPSFVGREITSILFHRNRLALISGENFIASETGEYFNFFRKTVTTVLDTDPIDIAVAHTKVATLRHAVPINKELILFTDRTQFALNSGNVLTPSTVSIDPITEFEVSSLCPPAATGRFIYFATELSDSSQIREFYVDPEASEFGVNDAADITAHVPTYIPKGTFLITASTTNDVVALLSKDDPGSLYLYKYFWQGNEKLQSSWGKWTFGDDVEVRHASFVGPMLVLLMERPDGVSIETLSIEENASDSDFDFVVRLDRRLTEAQCSTAYDAGSGTTTITAPYGEDDLVVVARPGGTETAGRMLQVVSRPADDEIVVRGDYTSQPFYVGKPYAFRYRFSNFVVRETAPGGGRVSVLDGRLQITSVVLNYYRTGFFDVEVTPLHRDTSVYRFTGRELGDGNSKLGQVPIRNGEFRFAVLSKNDQVTIDLVNSSYLPCGFTGVEWTGDITIRNQRL